MTMTDVPKVDEVRGGPTAGLLTWLRAQVDEDERAARAVAALRETWTVAGGYEETGPTRVAADDGYVIVEDDTDWAAEIVTHIALHDPARALREVEAKRRIVDGWQVLADDDFPDAQDLAARAALWRALLWLSSVYIDRPGYREEWRPEERRS